MRKVALKGLAGRKVRALLTAIAIVLGVAMISGSFVLTDTISKAFDSIFTSSYRQTDAVISGKKLVDYSASGNAPVSADLLARVRGLEDVEAAAPAIMDLAGNSTYAKLIDKDGKAIQSNGNPSFGFGIDASQARFNPMRLVDGAWASGGTQVVIDAETASKHDFAVGDTIGVSANGPTRRFRISGIAKFGDVNSLGGATIAVFDIPTAQSVLRMKGYSAISVAAKDGISQEQIVRELRDVLPANARVKTADEQAEADKGDIGVFISFIRGFLLAFGAIALFVGAFVIFNTLSITVAQRTRELATLRTLGASRRQVMRSVVLEALVLGALASVVGLFLGFGLARGLSSLLGALGLSLPESSPVYAMHTFVVSLLVGIVITVLAGVFPALRATRVSPISAVREGATIARKKRLGPTVGTVLFALGAGLVLYAVTGGRIGDIPSLFALGGGMLLMFVGLAGFASKLVAALTAVVGYPSRRFGGAAGKLATENATRNPARTASTAAALMIGLALVTFVAVLASGVRNSFDHALKQQFTSDFVLTSQNGWGPFAAGAGDAAAKAAGVEQATSIRFDRGKIGESQVTVNGIDPKTVGGLYRFQWKEGSDATLGQLGSDGVVMKRAFARDNGYAVGDSFTLRNPAGEPVKLHVVGLYQPPRIAEMLGGVVMSQQAFDRHFPRPSNQYTLVRGSSLAALKQAVSNYPDAKVSTRDDFVKAQSSFISQMLNMLYVLLGLSVIVSLFGMVNTLVLSVFERTRELGMLRAVGLTRRQTRRMVRHESVMTALIGAALGLPVGIFFAAAVTHALGSVGVTFSLPPVPLVVFTVVAIVAGVLAAIAPARRASRLNVLNALQYE